MVPNATPTVRTSAPMGSFLRLTHRPSLEPRPGACVSTFEPASHRATSSATSSAVAKRFSGSFSRHLSAIAERPAGASGFDLDGGSGSPVKMRPIVPNWVGALKGTVSASIS